MADAKHLFINPGFGVGPSYFASNFVIDATTDQVEFIFQADEAITITRLGFRYGARALTPPTHIISLQGVSLATGNPDGTIKGGGSPASATFTPPADTTWDGTWRWITLANAYTCTRGEFLAIVIAYSSGTVSGTNNSTFTVTDGLSLHSAAEGLPYAIQNNAGTRTRQASKACFAYGSAGSIYGFPSKQAFTSAAITQSSTPDEYATRFVIPAGWGASYQVAGLWARLILPAGDTMKVQLYDGTTVLQTMTYDTDLVSVNAQNRTLLFLFQESTLSTLLTGNAYRIGFQPQDAAGNYTFNGVTQNSNAEWEPYPLGIEWYSSSRTDVGAWSDDNTTRLACELLLKDLNPGGTAPPGITRVGGLGAVPVY